MTTAWVSLQSKAKLISWTQSADKDLLKGAIIVVKYQFPGLDENKIHETIQMIRKDIWLELNDHQTAFEQVKIFNRIFNILLGFGGNFMSNHSDWIHYVIKVRENF